jgi:hypothetical protein
LGIAVPLDHFLGRRNMLSEKLIFDHFGEQILTIMMMSSPPKSTTRHLPVGTESKSSKNVKTSTATSSAAAKVPPPVEYGPQLPQQQEKTAATPVTGEGVASWGKEPYGSPGFTWFKFLTRTTVELLLATGVAIAVAMFMNSNSSQSNVPRGS